MITVENLIEQLSQVSDKSKKIYDMTSSYSDDIKVVEHQDHVELVQVEE